MGVFLYSKALMRQHAPMPALEVLAPVTINGIYSYSWREGLCSHLELIRGLLLIISCSGVKD